MSAHDYFMQQALSLAARATGCTSPNPLVGCVVVRTGNIIGEGWHHRAGEAHAEVNALAAAQASAQGDTRGATLYVTLEPCSHHGRTPPCTKAIIDAGIRTVVYAASDPGELAGGGAAVLRDAGVEVVAGVCADAAREQNRFFFHHLQNKTPYTIAKFASSLDGRTATRTGHSQWITGEAARSRGHELRQAVDAIITGSGTVIADDPQLTVRPAGTPSVEAEQQPPISHPLRVVLDFRARVPMSAKIANGSLPGKTLFVTGEAMSAQHESQLLDNGNEVLRIEQADNSYTALLRSLTTELGQRNIQSMLVEGGQTLLGSFFDANLVHELWAFYAPILIGGSDALPAIGGLGIDKLDGASHLQDMQIETLGKDLLLRGKLTGSQPPTANAQATEDATAHATTAHATTAQATTAQATLKGSTCLPE